MSGERMPKKLSKLPKRIAITGPESSGKSTLARKLASYYHTTWVGEYAVDYLAVNGPDYSMKDVLQIANRQLEYENNLAGVASKYLFCDTDFLVLKIWCEVVFGEVPLWIEKQLKNHIYDLYLLCSPDLPWKPGPFRENPNDREYLYLLYLKQLEGRKLNFKIVTGNGSDRFKNALHFVEAIEL